MFIGRCRCGHSRLQATEVAVQYAKWTSSIVKWTSSIAKWPSIYCKVVVHYCKVAVHYCKVAVHLLQSGRPLLQSGRPFIAKWPSIIVKWLKKWPATPDHFFDLIGIVAVHFYVFWPASFSILAVQITCWDVQK